MFSFGFTLIVDILDIRNRKKIIFAVLINVKSGFLHIKSLDHKEVRIWKGKGRWQL